MHSNEHLDPSQSQLANTSANRLSAGNINRSSSGYIPGEQHIRTPQSDVWQRKSTPRRTPIETIPKTISPIPDFGRSRSPGAPRHVTPPVSSTADRMDALPEHEAAADEEWYAEEEMPYEFEQSPPADEADHGLPFGGRQGMFKPSSTGKEWIDGMISHVAARTVEPHPSTSPREEMLPYADEEMMGELREEAHFIDDEYEKRLEEERQWQAELERREREWQEAEQRQRLLQEELQRQKEEQQRLWQEECDRERRARADDMHRAEQDMLAQQQQFLGNSNIPKRL